MRKAAQKWGKIWAEQAPEAADTGLRVVGIAFTGRVAGTGSVQAAEAAAAREAAVGWAVEDIHHRQAMECQEDAGITGIMDMGGMEAQADFR